MKFSKEIEVFNPPLASTASSGPWIHSVFAFTHSWPRKTLFKRDSAVTHHLYGDISRDVQGTSENGVIFQKCAVVSVQGEWPSAHVRLFVNNTRRPTAANLSDLLLLDNITGLTVRESAGNQTSRGFQAFRKKFLQVGDSFSVSYTASLEARDVGTGDILLLPAQLSFQIVTCLERCEVLEIATLNRADSDLEACRTQISKDIIALLLKNLTSSGQLSLQVERRMAAVFRKQFLLLEKEIQEEYDRKMVALTAECDLEARKKTESQYQREMAAMEEAEEVLKRVSERSAVECSSLLRTLHGLEQEHLRRSLALEQEEDLAKAHRQLAIFQRNQLHSIFFTQIKSAIFKGELKPEAAKMLLQDYSKIQESVEELMDFFQASKRYHLSKRFGHREYLVQNIQSLETRVQGLLSTASTQLTLLIQKHERAGYLDEDQMQVLLERAQTEVFSIKQKLDNDLKQEKKKLHQKLIIKRRREMLQKHKEQRREQLSIAEASGAAEDAGQYLGQWRGLMAEQSAALEELQERLDQAALDELRALTLSLSEKATEELRRLQNSGMTQELLKRGVPWLFLQQILEEHGRDLAARAERLESEERDRGQEGVQSVRQRLKDDALEASTEEQAELRHWEHLIFTKLCSSAFSLSEEELLGMRQEVHGCFSQMDRSLALPKIRARVLLQQFQTAWREAEFLKLDQAVAAPELQVRGELLRERVQQLEAEEGRFAESLVSLQFQKAARMARTLWAYTALLSIQDLLLEELSASETLTKSACMQILESHSPELQELERKLEDRLAHQEAAQLQRALDSRQQWAGEGPGLLQEPEETDSERQVSAVLRRALSKGQKLLEHHRKSLREEQEDSVLLEDLLENMETDTFVTLYGQELRLASYLSKLTMLPGGTLRRLLTVALPAASQAELLAVLDSVGQKHQDHVAENDGGGAQADLGRRGKHQGWWQALESKLRGELINRGLEKMLWAQKRKESILKKTRPPLRERVIFSGKGSWPHLSLESIDELTPVSIVGAEAVDLLNTGEKLFIFRNPKEPEISLHIPPRKKKKNFLNTKKAAWALGMN
ncbi:hypothetical protein FD754_022758 [Muntiacus muntjak]|uniref:Limbin n=1 Tax=Muntiacus muntjak TaxID=9888 RepID=A0A5N3V956_MUNMU|nr:hypothetical protein FD754_022758 [Muntiacus muntjak]